MIATANEMDTDEQELCQFNAEHLVEHCQEFTSPERNFMDFGISLNAGNGAGAFLRAGSSSFGR